MIKMLTSKTKILPYESKICTNSDLKYQKNVTRFEVKVKKLAET